MYIVTLYLIDEQHYLANVLKEYEKHKKLLKIKGVKAFFLGG